MGIFCYMCCLPLFQPKTKISSLSLSRTLSGLRAAHRRQPGQRLERDAFHAGGAVRASPSGAAGDGVREAQRPGLGCLTLTMGNVLDIVHDEVRKRVLVDGVPPPTLLSGGLVSCCHSGISFNSRIKKLLSLL